MTGVVGQEPVLFSGTIRDNITLGMDNVSEAELIAASKTANAHKFITKLVNVSVERLLQKYFLVQYNINTGRFQTKLLVR